MYRCRGFDQNLYLFLMDDTHLGKWVEGLLDALIDIAKTTLHIDLELLRATRLDYYHHLNCSANWNLSDKFSFVETLLVP